MSAETRPIQPGVEQERAPVILIDSSNFHLYLLAPDLPLIKEENIAERLVLPVFAPLWQDIDGRSRGFRSAEAAPQKMQLSGEIYPGTSSSSALSHFLEASGAFFYDHERKLVVPSDVTLGTEDEVEMPIYGLIREGKPPAIAGHSHEKNLLSSAPDLVPHSQKYINEEPQARLLRASVIICPDYQLMHVVTADTPLMTEDQIEDDLNTWRKQQKTLKQEVASLRAFHEADPHDELAARRYNKALYGPDHELRVQRIKKRKLANYVSYDFETWDRIKNFDDLPLAA